MDRQQDIAEKATPEHDEPILKETAHQAAERGHAATDMYDIRYSVLETA